MVNAPGKTRGLRAFLLFLGAFWMFCAVMGGIMSVGLAVAIRLRGPLLQEFVLPAMLYTVLAAGDGFQLWRLARGKSRTQRQLKNCRLWLWVMFCCVTTVMGSIGGELRSQCGVWPSLLVAATMGLAMLALGYAIDRAVVAVWNDFRACPGSPSH